MPTALEKKLDAVLRHGGAPAPAPAAAVPPNHRLSDQRAAGVGGSLPKMPGASGKRSSLVGGNTGGKKSRGLRKSQSDALPVRTSVACKADIWVNPATREDG